MMTLIYRGGCEVEYLASNIDDHPPSCKEIEIAKTLLARDSKGIGNFNVNAVIEVYRIDGCKSDRSDGQHD